MKKKSAISTSEFPFSSEVYTMILTSDEKMDGTLAKAHSLSYNILKFGSKSSKDNEDIGQRTMTCTFVF